MAIEPKLELAIDGTFTDVTEDAYFEDGITHDAGASAEGSETDPTVVNLRLKSPDGKYSNRNPLSPYFGQIGRNTPARASVGNATATMLLPLGAGLAAAHTPDTAALDITGDIDIRIDLSPDGWAGEFLGGYQELAAKWQISGNNWSWGLFVDEDGNPYFTWSPDGSTVEARESDTAVPFGPRRRGAVRVTLDVDNGDGGNTTTFYTAPTIDGPWAQLGSPLTDTGVTSILSGTAALDVGDASGFGAGIGSRRQIHAFELRNGIGGTVVANPVFLGQPVGTTSFADGTGKVWTLSGGAAITDRRNRFTVEASEWQPRWKVGADDVSTPVTGGGLMRRLTQGESPLDSTLRRRIPSFNPIAYWPMEDGENALEAASAVPDVRPLLVSGFTFQSDGTLGGSRALPEVSPGSIMRANIPQPPPGSPTEWTLAMVYRYTGTRPVSNAEFLAWRAGGTVARWRILMRDGTATVEGYDNDLNLLFTQSANVHDDVWDDWVRYRFTVQEVAGTVNWRLTFVNIGMGGGSISNSYAGTAGHVSEIRTAFGSSISAGRLIVGHLSAIQETDPTLNPYDFADHGFNEERSGSRMERLAEEEGVPLRVIGETDTTPEMGPQEIATFLENMRSCEAVDGGVLYEDPDRVGLLYRTRKTKYRQEPILTVPYSSLVQPLEPTDDDQLTRNDITRRRINGASVTVRQETGPMSTELPPLGVGRYTDSQDLNVALDAQLEQQAGWALHRGTWDEARYQKITVLLHKHPELIPMVAEMQIGDLIRITDLPPFLPPGPVDLIVEGYRENITGLTWELVMNCSPGGIWGVGVADDENGAAGDNGNRADTSGSTLVLAAADDDRTLYVESEGSPWINTADFAGQFPFSVTLGGERVMVSGARGILEDNFNRTVSSSWGTSSDGRPWIETGGLPADRGVNGTSGTLSLPATPGTWRIQRTGLVLGDCEVLARFSMAQVHTGASYDYCAMLRWGSDTDFYVVRASFTTSGAVQMRIYTNDEGTVGSVITTPWTYTGGQEFYLRARVDGQRIRGRIWPVLTAREPNTWDVDGVATTTPNATGDVGVLVFGGAGLSSANPSSSTTEFRANDPQVLELGVETDSLADDFDRVVSNGWGTATSGQAWANEGGTAADFEVTGTSGNHLISTDGAFRITSVPSAVDSDTRADFAFDQLPVGDSEYVYLAARRLDDTNMYFARVQVTAAGSMFLTIRKRVGGETLLSATLNTGFTYAADVPYTLRFSAVDNRLKAKLWLAAGSEPDNWMLQVTDSDLTAAGSIALRTLLGGSATNTLPVTVSFSSLSSAQFESGRSQNGIVKAHDAGTPLSLTYPARAAL